ncbi:hypothetical protein [Sphingomonas montanisoli]|uniref:Uncharacterized protein n=1 Tax=Sphingomonas montanisoli TaxID=2606412 RepID=A0A5D9BZ85_9SPHN|nr:hypothetical protein [Sphingomonas montanisoli]TZG24734.1 hypothetical protein FYJ91_19190 [Sphingomonas montanisoli]
MKHVLPFIVVVSLLGSQPATAATTLCDVIRSFETAVPAKIDNPRERRWIEFHWGFDHSPGTIWSWGCQHSTQAIASQTCGWLKDNTNQEFAMMLPHGIMACYGYRFPAHANTDWSELKGTIALHGRNGNRLLLDLNYRDLPLGEVAMRLAVEHENGDYIPEELPAIATMPVTKTE